jgi:hypothetical protein
MGARAPTVVNRQVRTDWSGEATPKVGRADGRGLPKSAGA